MILGGNGFVGAGLFGVETTDRWPGFRGCPLGLHLYIYICMLASTSQQVWTYACMQELGGDEIW